MPSRESEAPAGRLAALGGAAGFVGGLLGVGGGLILVPGLVWAAGLDRHTATGTSLLAILPVAIVGTATYALGLGEAFDVRVSAAVVVGSLAGAVVGARLNSRLSERGLRLAFAFFSLAVGLRLVVPAGLGAGAEITLSPGVVALLGALGFVGGILAGLLGVGGSLIVIAVMVLALDTSQVLAQGIAFAAVIPTAIVGAMTHHRLGSLAPRAALWTGLAGGAAAVPGVLAAFALPAPALRAIFGAFLILTAGRTLRALRSRRPPR